VSDDEACHAIQDKVHVLAMALVNEGAERSALRARPHGTCLRYEPAIESLAPEWQRSGARATRANSYASRSGSCISGRRGHSPGD
jgi:hypothetical protein